MGLLKKKSLWLGALFLLVLGGATLFVIHKELKGQDIIGTLKSANIWWVLLAIMAMAIYAVADGINISRCLKLDGYKISFAQMMKYSFAGFFFEGITQRFYTAVRALKLPVFSCILRRCRSYLFAR